jgi:hypothetical protein
MKLENRESKLSEGKGEHVSSSTDTEITVLRELTVCQMSSANENCLCIFGFSRNNIRVQEDKTRLFTDKVYIK